jgi:DNA-binding XRE family transcriptional regulator
MTTRLSLKQARALAQMSQDALARRVGLTTSAVEKIERGVRSPKLATRTAIAHVLGLGVDEIVWGAPEDVAHGGSAEARAAHIRQVAMAFLRIAEKARTGSHTRMV